MDAARRLGATPGFAISGWAWDANVSIQRGDPFCWEWTGSLTATGGYVRPRYHAPSGHVYVRTEVFAATHPDYNPMMVTGRCGNPRCVRPDHLIAGRLSSFQGVGQLGLVGLGSEREWRSLAEAPGFPVHPEYLHGRIQVLGNGCWRWLGGFRLHLPFVRQSERDIYIADEMLISWLGEKARGVELHRHARPRCGDPACVRPDHMLPVPLRPILTARQTEGGA